MYVTGDNPVLDFLFEIKFNSVCVISVTHVTDYHQASNIRRGLVGNDIPDHSDVVGASPVGAAPTTSSFSILHLAWIIWTDISKMRREIFKFWGLVLLVIDISRYPALITSVSFL